eukprot:174287_1
MSESRVRNLTEHLQDLREDMKEEGKDDFKDHDHDENCRCINKRKKPNYNQSRRKTKYEDFLKIQQKISKEKGPKFAAMLYWDNGIWCKVCQRDIKLHGLFIGYACVVFNYTKCISHIFCNKHKHRCNDEEILLYLKFEKVSNDENKLELLKKEETELKSILNLFNLCFMSAVTGFKLYTIGIIQEFIRVECNGLIFDGYMSRNSHKEIIVELGETQKSYDKKLIIKWSENGGIGICFDGNSKKYQPVKSFHARGWEREKGIDGLFMCLISNKKRITMNGTNIADLLTCDSGEDNLEKIDKVLADFEVNDKNVNSITPDGAAQNIGKNLGSGALFKYNRNRDCQVIWGLIHRVNLILKHGMGGNTFKKHIDMVKSLHRYFHSEITGQIFDAFAIILDEKQTTIKSVDSDKYNYLFEPVKSINENIDAILNTLRYLVNHEKKCVKYKTAKRTNPDNPPTVIPEPIILYDYFRDLKNIILNVVFECVFFQNNITIKLLSDTTLDIITAYNYVFDWKTITQSLCMSSFANDKHDAIEQFRSKLKVFSHPNLAKVTLGNFSWNVSNDYLDNTYRVLMKKLGDAYLAHFDRYFNEMRMKIMRYLKYLLDFKSFNVYDEMKEAANHGLQQVSTICEYFSKNSDDIREWRWHDIDEELLILQYDFMKKFLFENMKKSDVKSMKIRIKMITLEIDGQRHIYTEWTKFLFPLMTMHGVTIENESDFSLKEFFLGNRRRHMKLPLLDHLLRLKINSKQNPEDKRKLIVASMIRWNLKAKRLHSAAFLNLLSATETSNTNNDTKTAVIKELLAERNNRINTIANNNMMEDFQEENVFLNADLLSELIFSEQAIERVEAANGSNRN